MVPPVSASIQDRILSLIQSLQFAWFMGHLLTWFGAFYYFLSIILFHTRFIPYRIAYVGALISYGVVVYKSIGAPQFNAHYARKLIMDENSQYLILATFWLFSRPIMVSLIPYMTFSTFHVLDYIRTSIIPTLFPRPVNTTSTDGVPSTWQTRVQGNIKSLYDQHYSPAMRVVSRVEVIIIPGRLFLGALGLQIIPFLLYTQFLRFKYHLSVYTRQAFSELRAYLDKLLLPQTNPRIPAFVPKSYVAIKQLLSKFGETPQQRTTNVTST